MKKEYFILRILKALKRPAVVIMLFTAMWVPFLLLEGCQRSEAVNKESHKEKDSIPEFKVYVARTKRIKKDLIGLGTLEVLNKATVITPIDGIIEDVYVKKGDRVNKGEKLFYISNYNLEIEYSKAEKALMEASEGLATAKIQYEEEKKNLYKKFIQLEKTELEILNMEEEISYLSESLKKKKILFEKGGLTEETYKNLEFTLKAKKNQLEVMKKDYELSSYGFGNSDIVAVGYDIPKDKKGKEDLLVYINTRLQRKRMDFAKISLKKAELDRDRVSWLMEKRRIKAPSSGFVTDIGKFKGEKVNANDVLTTLIDLSTLIARASFSEKDLNLFKEGYDADVKVEATGEIMRGKIYTIDPYVDKDTRTVKVDCIIKNNRKKKGLLLPGMFVKVIIPSSKIRESLLIPNEAILAGEESSDFVFIVSREARVYKREIVWSNYNDEYAIVEEGIKKGDTVILNPVKEMRNGMKVSIGL